MVTCQRQDRSRHDIGTRTQQTMRQQAVGVSSQLEVFSCINDSRWRRGSQAVVDSLTIGTMPHENS